MLCLCGLEWSAVVCPAERPGAFVVVVDERENFRGEVIDRGELAVADQPALQDREEQLHLVQPRRVGGSAVQEHVMMRTGCPRCNATPGRVGWPRRGRSGTR